MEFLFYQDEWQGLKLQEIYHAQNRTIADSTFYRSFYETLLTQGKDISKKWVAQKHNISEWLESEYLIPMLKRDIAPKILSIGAGLGIIEEPLLRKGYRIDLQECQEKSLENIIKAHPNVKYYICDCRNMRDISSNSYDMVYAVGVDYIFGRYDYKIMLDEIARLIKPDGIVIVVNISNISITGLFRELIRPFYYGIVKKDSRGIPWGYKRTLGEHFKIGRYAELTPIRCFIADKYFERMKQIKLNKVIPLPIRGDIVVIEFVMNKQR
jgi:2-polyprenyl-3-methyl-5-hydroxy-6-metoxy-1,4-benzoquinol methylase